jgi:dTDP-4-dehydrorhamnose reductase
VIVVTGAHGQVGTAIMELLPEDAVGLTRTDLDLREIGSIRRVLHRHSPSAIINCAAYTAVDQAETDQSTARTVNAEAVGEMANVARDLDSKFVTFSTDYVFDGEKIGSYVESDATGPINVYGESKLEGEHLALEANSESLIIRTSWVISGTHRSFVSTMIRLIRRGPVRVVNDQRGRPTMAEDLATGTIAALEAEASGLLHMTNSEEMTWFDLAREIADFADLDATNVDPCSTEEFPRPALRPKNSCLSSERLHRFDLLELPSSRFALERAVKRLVDEGA